MKVGNQSRRQTRPRQTNHLKAILEGEFLPRLGQLPPSWLPPKLELAGPILVIVLLPVGGWSGDVQCFLKQSFCASYLSDLSEKSVNGILFLPLKKMRLPAGERRWDVPQTDVLVETTIPALGICGSSSSLPGRSCWAEVLVLWSFPSLACIPWAEHWSLCMGVSRSKPGEPGKKGQHGEGHTLASPSDTTPRSGTTEQSDSTVKLASTCWSCLAQQQSSSGSPGARMSGTPGLLGCRGCESSLLLLHYLRGKSCFDSSGWARILLLRGCGSTSMVGQALFPTAFTSVGPCNPRLESLSDSTSGLNAAVVTVAVSYTDNPLLAVRRGGLCPGSQMLGS